jgi:pyruvate dehydrogenase E2 component (dihydrolipoamide acetyltransferase)
MMESTLNNDWRKIASSIYRKPSDSKIFGSVELDVTDLEKFVAQKRREGLKITLTHIFTLAVSRALRDEVPELNCYVRRGNIIPRKQVDTMVSVLIKGGQMSSVLVRNTDMLSLAQLSDALTKGINKTRSGEENMTMRMKGRIARIPWPFRGWIFRLIKFFTVGAGISIPSIGLTANNFGSFVMTNIGTIGLDTGFPALFPVSNVSFVFVMGGISKKPVVVDDEVVIRRMITLSAAMDHRLVDAVHGGKLFRYIRNIVSDPGILESERTV